MKSYLLSTLKVEFEAAGPEAFMTTAPHPWLLWAPDRWKPPLRQTAPLPPDTRPPSESAALARESLAIELVPLTRPVVLGRAAECDLIINDGRLSARHLAFHFSADGWSAEDLGSTNGTRVDGQALEPGAPCPLVDGACIDAAQVVLLFLTSERLWPRLMAS